MSHPTLIVPSRRGPHPKLISFSLCPKKIHLALLHCNGSISDLNYHFISNEYKCALFENKHNEKSFKIPPKDYKELKQFLKEKVYPRLNKNEHMESAKNRKYGMTLRNVLSIFLWFVAHCGRWSHSEGSRSVYYRFGHIRSLNKTNATL